MAFFYQREVMRENLLQPFTQDFTHAEFLLTLLKSDFVGIEQSDESGSGAEII